MMISPRISIGTHLRIAYAYSKLQASFGFKVARGVGLSSKKCISFFTKAYARWMLDLSRKGMNPFADRIKASDFVSVADIKYYVERNVADEAVQNSQWDWLDAEFAKIHSILQEVHQGFISVLDKKTKISLTFVWDDNESITYQISKIQYRHLKTTYLGEEKNFNLYVLLMLTRYYACGTTNNHCSVPKEVIEFCGIDMELFGSPLNTCLKHFCSPFYDIEQKFGSLGSFFDFEIETGVYLMNPPYDEELMIEAAKKVIKALQSCNEIVIVAILPMWDISSQQTSGPVVCNKEFEALKMFEASGFITSKALLSHDKHKFYDYYSNKFVAVTNVHMLILSNTSNSLVAKIIADYWLEVVGN